MTLYRQNANIGTHYIDKMQILEHIFYTYLTESYTEDLTQFIAYVANNSRH